MSSPRFPSTATLLDAKRCPLDKFDALFTKITQERRIRDGYFLHEHSDEARLLFIVNGSPYGAGRVTGETCTVSEIHEFFTAYAERPLSPLSFFVADKRLLLGLMVLFRHQPALSFKTDVADIAEVLNTLAERNTDQIVVVCSGDEWALSLCTTGRPAVNFLPPGLAEVGEPAPADQLAAYVRNRPGGSTIDVYEETRVGPAGDVLLVTPETRGRLVEVFLKVAAKVREEELEVAPVLQAPADVQTPAALEEPLTLDTDAPASLEPIEAPAMAEPPTPVESDAISLEPLELESSTGMSQVAVEPPPEPAPATASQAAPPKKGPIPEVILLHGDKQLGVFSLAGGELTIGRTPGNTIMIDNAGVSRRHAVIRVKGDKAILEDLGSANGTFIRGQKVEEYELRDGDEVSIVKHRLVYRVPKESESPPKLEPIPDVGQRTMYIDAGTIAQAVGRQTPRTEAAASMLRPRLILPDLKKFALEEDEVRLGSGTGCQIQLSGMFVGKVHAKIVRGKEGQFKLQHLSGLAGTRVNGEKIAEHVLKHGDEIEIGKQKLLFRLER